MESTHFKEHELRCKHCGENKVQPELLAFMEKVRRDFGKPMVVTSAYRCPVYNSSISSTGTTGPHTTGLAVDIAVRGADANELLRIAYKHGVKGVGVQQKGDGRFIHLDLLADRMWSY